MKTNSKRMKASERFVITFIPSLLLGADAYGGYGYLEGSGQLETPEYRADTIPKRVAPFGSVAASMGTRCILGIQAAAQS